MIKKILKKFSLLIFIFGFIFITQSSPVFAEGDNFVTEYVLTGDAVYFEDKIISNVDIESFVLIDNIRNCDYHNEYAKDKNSIYNQGDKIIIVDNDFKKVKEPDVESFKFLTCEYAKDKDNVYYFSFNHGFQILAEADPLSFRLLEGDYVRDDKHIYKDGVSLPDVDLETFFVFSGNEKDWYIYAGDKNHVYIGHNIIEIDPSVFQSLGYCYYKDENYVYHEGGVVENCDPDSVEVINADIIKDSDNMFYQGRMVDWYDVPTLQGINSQYIKDKNGVYFIGKDVIDGLDPDDVYVPPYSEEFFFGDLITGNDKFYMDGLEMTGVSDFDSFQFLNIILAKDKNYVYSLFDCDGPDLSKCIINGADSETFIMLDSSNDSYFAKDKNKIYFLEDDHDFDVKSFVFIDNRRCGDYAKDINGVYFLNYDGSYKNITDADIATFSCANSKIAKDKNYFYINGEVIAKNDGNNTLSTAKEKFINVQNKNMYSKLKGKIMLKVEDSGKAYYISPNNETMYYLGRPDDAFQVMRQQGVGITNKDLYKIPIGINSGGVDTDGDGLSDYLENSLGLDAGKKDTDGDGYNDKDELENGYSPWGSGKQNINNNFASKQSGRILLQVENNGEAWYVNPNDNKRYFLGRPADAFSVMRNLGLGISNNDFDNL